MMFRGCRTGVLALMIAVATAGSASACPMCKLANETNSRLPQAYMYSILFMLSMPATLATAFGIGFYRLSRKANSLQHAAGDDSSAPTESRRV